MVMLILAVMALIAGIVFALIMNKYDMDEWRAQIAGRGADRAGPKPKRFLLPLVAGILVAAIFIGFACIATVPTGYTGILTTFGKVEDRTLPSGVNVIAPWQKVVKMDNRTQKVQIQTAAFSSDIQQVDIQLSVNFCIDQNTAQILYRTVGVHYYENVMYPRIVENTKAVFSQYSAEDLIAHRSSLADAIAETTAADMEQYGITIVSIAIEDVDFTDAFTDAVEAKQVAQQNKLKAQTEAEQRVIEAEAAANVKRVQADAEAYEVLARAEAEAKANQMIAESITPELINYDYAQRWDGELPTIMSGTNGAVIVNAGDILNGDTD